MKPAVCACDSCWAWVGVDALACPCTLVDVAVGWDKRLGDDTDNALIWIAAGRVRISERNELRRNSFDKSNTNPASNFTLYFACETRSCQEANKQASMNQSRVSSTILLKSNTHKHTHRLFTYPLHQPVW